MSSKLIEGFLFKALARITRIVCQLEIKGGICRSMDISYGAENQFNNHEQPLSRTGELFRQVVEG